MNSTGISRRHALVTGAMVLTTPTAIWAQEGRVVETAQGRYRGRAVNGVHVFKGMHYGASTAGEMRFMPPQRVVPFAGVRDAFDYGDQAHQYREAIYAQGPVSEDCLRINIWSPNPGDGRKRPVMLWLHGGGFESGSGSSPRYDGVNMVKRGDVVLCTINHRLNVFGFCDLSNHLGPEFAQSGNLGYLDIVAAMKWVRENIAAFGGNPDNVMIYGQSGGGRKVSICFAGKEAAGYFHKGVAQSGSHLMVLTKEQSNALTDALLRKFSINPKNARDLQKIPALQLSALQRDVIAAAGYRFEPVMDGIAFSAHPFIPGAPARTAKVPLMVGTAQTELSNQLGRDPAVYTMDEATLKRRLRIYVPEPDIDEAIRVFKESTPGGSPTELFFKITSWRSYIKNATLMAEARDALNGRDNPTWMYQVTWRSPAEGGRRLSQHGLDLPFMFDNVNQAAAMVGPPSEQTRVMADAMANAWLAFAHKGDPNHAGIPTWPTYDAATRPVMEFNVPPRLAKDPFRNEREFMARYEPVRTTWREDA